MQSAVCVCFWLRPLPELSHLFCCLSVVKQGPGRETQDRLDATERKLQASGPPHPHPPPRPSPAIPGPSLVAEAPPPNLHPLGPPWIKHWDLPLKKEIGATFDLFYFKTYD